MSHPVLGPIELVPLSRSSKGASISIFMMPFCHVVADLPNGKLSEETVQRLLRQNHRWFGFIIQQISRLRYKGASVRGKTRAEALLFVVVGGSGDR